MGDSARIKFGEEGGVLGETRAGHDQEIARVQERTKEREGGGGKEGKEMSRLENTKWRRKI